MSLETEPVAPDYSFKPQWTLVEALAAVVTKVTLGVLIIIPAAGILLPIATMLFCSFSQTWSSAGVHGFTLDWYSDVLNYPGFVESMILSLKIACLTVLVCNVIGLSFSYAVVKYRFIGKNLLVELLRLPIIIPGLVFALGLIISFGNLYGTWYLIWIAHVVFSLPFYIEPIINALRAFDFVTLENAAKTLGASRLQSQWLILLPLLRIPVLIGSATVFTISWSEFNITFLLSSANAYPISGLLYSAYTGTSVQFSSAASMVFICVLIPFLLGLNYYSGRKILNN